MKKLTSILGVAGLLAVGTAAWAQEPVPAEDLEVHTTTETTTSYDAVPMEETTYATMPATGGAPIAMALFGTLTAAGAYFTRRKLS